MKSTDRPPCEPSPSCALAGEAGVALYYGLVEQLTSRGASGAESQLFTADFVEHDGAGDGQYGDFVARLAARRAHFPDGVWTIELLAGVGELVICHTTMTCPASSGRTVREWETVVVRMDAGRIAESWRIRGEPVPPADARDGGVT
jgi:predicted ester cyclase